MMQTAMFHSLSFRWKTTLLTTTVAATVLLLASVMLFLTESASLLTDLLDDADIQADLIAEQCVPGLLRGDHGDVQREIVRFGRDPRLAGVRVALADGTPVASYRGGGSTYTFPESRVTEARRVDLGYITVLRPIMADDRAIGSVALAYDLRHLRAALTRQIVTFLSVFVAATIVSFILAARFHRVLVLPIQSLAETARRVAQHNDYRVRAERFDDDEIGDLVDAFNEMLTRIEDRDDALEAAHDQLEERVSTRTAALVESNGRLRAEIRHRRRAERERESLNEALREASRRSGMAEVATGVLHDVGNVVNSVNVSVALLRERLRRSRVDRLHECAGMLLEHHDDLAEFIRNDKRGVHLPEYVGRLAEHLASERREVQAELDSMSTAIDRLKGIIRAQQNLGRTVGVESDINLKEIVEDAFRLNTSAIRQHEIEWHVELDDLPVIRGDRPRILQIILNLVANAVNALAESGNETPWIVVRGSRTSLGRIRLELTDNGVGIPTASLARIFAHGYTTRPDGHGFGLHHSANTAAALGGALWAISEGPGHGASFMLELPIEPKRRTVRKNVG